MNFIMLINVKMPTVVGILTFISMMNTNFESLKAIKILVWPHSAVSSKSDCRSRVSEFDPSPVPYFLMEIDHEIFFG